MTAFAPIVRGQLAYDVTGKGQPLILIHGSLLDRQLWEPQVAAFARNHQVIRYDARGHGMSSSDVVPYAHEHDLLGLLDHLRIKQATLIGLSMGARIALQFALTWPERVRSLVLVGSGMDRYTYGPEIHAGRAAMSAARAGGLVEDEIEAFLALWVVGPGRQRGQVDPAILASVREMARRALAQPSLDGCELPFEPPMRPRLHTIESPTLVMVGEHDLPDMRAIADLLARHIPGAEYVQVAAAGHVVNLEQPAVFNDTVLAFLAHVQA